jgi:hypothetical protein
VGAWWSKPEWNPHKRHPSVLDLRRLVWRQRGQFSKLLVRLEDLKKIPQACDGAKNLAPRAA